MLALQALSDDIKQYLLITGNYWAFTLTDGALRMLVVLHFHQLGYSPLEIALLFLFYELFGVVTNLVGGWLGATLGLNKTMQTGLGLQIVALLMLTVPSDYLTVIWVMAAQALSGIAKDLNKMSAKSAIKLLVDDNAQSTLYRWVAILTGSKNTLKGVGFFIGGLLLVSVGFTTALFIMASVLALVYLSSVIFLKGDLGKTKSKPKFTDIFSKSRAINILSAARFFLFGARDVWFVVALPVYLSAQMEWGHGQVGGLMALWVIAYGMVQAIAPRFTGKKQQKVPKQSTAFWWASLLAIMPAAIALLLNNDNSNLYLLIGLFAFGAVFAINSSLHSYLIVSMASRESVSLDVGFYYMANAMGRLVGTVLSGWLFQQYGLATCLWISSIFISLAAILALLLPKPSGNVAT